MALMKFCAVQCAEREIKTHTTNRLRLALVGFIMCFAYLGILCDPRVGMQICPKSRGQVFTLDILSSRPRRSRFMRPAKTGCVWTAASSRFRAWVTALPSLYPYSRATSILCSPPNFTRTQICQARSACSAANSRPIALRSSGLSWRASHFTSSWPGFWRIRSHTFSTTSRGRGRLLTLEMTLHSRGQLAKRKRAHRGLNSHLD